MATAKKKAPAKKPERSRQPKSPPWSAWRYAWPAPAARA